MSSFVHNGDGLVFIKDNQGKQEWFPVGWLIDEMNYIGIPRDLVSITSKSYSKYHGLEYLEIDSVVKKFVLRICVGCPETGEAFAWESHNVPVDPSYPSVQDIQGYIDTLDTLIAAYSLLNNPPPPTVEQVHNGKIEELTEACNSEIHTGLVSDVLGSGHSYEYNSEDQAELALMILGNGEHKITCVDVDSLLKDRVLHTESQIVLLCNNGLVHKENNRNKLDIIIYEAKVILESEATESEKIEQLNALTWT